MEEVKNGPNRSLSMKGQEPRAIDRAKLPVVLAAAVPLMLVMLGLYAAQTRLDIFDSSSFLETRLQKARQAGLLSMTARTLPPSSTEGDKCFQLLTKWYPQLLVSESEVSKSRETYEPLVPQPKQMQTPWKFDAPLNTETIHVLDRSRRLSQFTSLSKMVDLDQPYYSMEGSNLGELVQLHARALLYEAAIFRERGNPIAAIKPLEQALRLVQLLKGDPTAMGVGRLLSLSLGIKTGSVKLIALLRKDRPAVSRLRILIRQAEAEVDLDRMMQSELRLILAFYRNYGSTVHRLLDSNNTRDVIRDQTPMPLVRSGLPNSITARSMLSRCVQNHLEINECLQKSKNIHEAWKHISRLDEGVMGTLTGRAAVFTMFGSYTLDNYRRYLLTSEMIEWAADIASEYGEVPPDSLPSGNQKDGTVMHYRPIEGGIEIYCNGLNGVNDHGPKSTLDADLTDDIGIKVIFIEPKSTTESGRNL
ncbi:MAG TPA: hypothetical protein VK171_01825 [Fimbriimonas sp.]|nr:hypothetical protein [Fimbriimonas sp.]